MHVIYDCETYPNCFIFCAEDAESDGRWSFEISARIDDSAKIVQWMTELRQSDSTMVGFNNIGFDYPIIHMLYLMGKATAQQLYDKAMAIIAGTDKFSHMVYPSNRIVRQIDLFTIHHFDNKARSTSLKALEFNMRMPNIKDLPFKVGTTLTGVQIDILRDYCFHDIVATKLFYEQTRTQIEFRQQLSSKYKGDVVNYSDVKLGKTIFQTELEANGVECYTVGPEGRTPKQTPRNYIPLASCIPNYIRFDRPEFAHVLNIFREKVIYETKGAFKNLTASVDGLSVIFGTGGIHASVESERFEATEEMMILDMDVTSMYPSIAIENNLFPEHLGIKFVEVYRQLRERRMSYPKESIENAALKLALNGVYGASGDTFSIFYDPLFTMRITVGGQLMMAMLMERLLRVKNLRIIQGNTDGVTVFMPRTEVERVQEICDAWASLTKLSLEFVEYRKMSIADVNSYLAVDTKGNVKRKGRYEHNVKWHQDASALVVPMIAERVLVDGGKIDDILMGWTDVMDFMLRAKIPRSSHLLLSTDEGERLLENTQRYYISQCGGELVKVMPPHPKKPDTWRRFKIQSGYTVCPCNDISEAFLPINFDWYRSEIETLVYGVM